MYWETPSHDTDLRHVLRVKQNKKEREKLLSTGLFKFSNLKVKIICTVPKYSDKMGKVQEHSTKYTSFLRMINRRNYGAN